MISFMFKIRHFKMKKNYPLLIGTIPLYYPPSAPSLNDINASTTTSFPMPTPGQFDRSHLPPETQTIAFVSPEQPFASSSNLDIRKQLIIIKFIYK